MGGDHDDGDHDHAPLDPRLKRLETRVDSCLKSKPGVYEKMLGLDTYKVAARAFTIGLRRRFILDVFCRTS